MYALAQKAGGPTSGHAGGAAMQQSNQNQSVNPSADVRQQNAPPSQNPSMNTTKMNPSSTPRGHHFGWQKGRHNPHHVSPTPSVAASAAAKTSSPNPTANPKDTSPPPLQSP
jgi:hypothetical protein